MIYRTKVEIYGILHTGARFQHSLMVTFNPKQMNIEEALIHHVLHAYTIIEKGSKSGIKTFNELIALMKWKEANWVYAEWDSGLPFKLRRVVSSHS